MLFILVAVDAPPGQAIGIKEGQRVCLCMPNVPQTVYCLYGLNRIGAVATMVHPLSAEGEK